jgi:hypothetical protein
MNELKEIRKQKDQFMHVHPQSPLTPEQKSTFSGLNYFDEDASLRLEVAVEPFEEQAEIVMQTSTGGTQTYRRYGRFQFEVAGEKAELTLFASPHGFFLPFVDSQAGTETYGAGRYLDPEPNEDGNFLIDFNDAYNPYCAYNEMWTCPIPPAENRLALPIMAGEKNYED